MAKNPGIMLPKDLADLVSQHQQVWAYYDQALLTKDQLEQLAWKIPEGNEMVAAFQPLSSSGQPPDELAAATEFLESELKKIGRLQKDVEDAERRRFNLILASVIAGVVLFLIFMFVGAAILGGRR